MNQNNLCASFRPENVIIMKGAYIGISFAKASKVRRGQTYFITQSALFYQRDYFFAQQDTTKHGHKSE